MKSLRPLAAVALIVFLYLLPIVHIPLLDSEDFDFPSLLFYPIGIFVLLAIGLYVTIGLAGLLNLGHVAFFAVGAYTMGLCNTLLGWPYFAVLPLAVAVSMVFGVLIAAPTLRLRGDYLAIATLGFGQVIQIFLTNAPGLGGVRGISGIAPPTSIGPLVFGVLDPVPFVWLVLTLILIAYFIVRRLESTHIGRGWNAIRADEDVAELMGVPTYRLKILAFAIGAGIAGAAGATYATKASFISPETFDLSLIILLIAALTIGGTRSLTGAIVGTLLVAYLPERFREFGDLRMLLFAAVLVLMVIFRPQGLFGRRLPREAESGSEVVENVKGEAHGTA
ncbi:MAG: branched-chain amino acid ABC transporter permease [Rhizobiaceae bacterium]|nr:MAG: branched-chain amino acid ABC transporter permease [Rhizobiaceae bacterium]